MDTKNASLYAAAAGIGVVTGMRTMTGPAIIGHVGHRIGEGASGDQFGLVKGRKGATALQVFALTEYVLDKLPSTPDRTAPIGLFFRAASGALCGALVCHKKNGSLLLGALAGMAGATAGTLVAYKLRKAIVKKLHIPDVIVGIAEDALAVKAGVAITRSVIAI